MIEFATAAFWFMCGAFCIYMGLRFVQDIGKLVAGEMREDKVKRDE